VSDVRRLRGLVPIEAAAVVATAAVALPVPRALPLFMVASLSRWLRGRPWGEVVRGDAGRAAIAAACGAAGLVLALVAATPVVEAIAGRDVEWSQFPVVRGGGAQLFGVAVVVGAGAVAAELALRGWILERALELGAHSWQAVALGGLAEALMIDGDIAARAGAALFGVALGWLYVAAGRDAAVSCAARLTFSVGAVVLESLRVIG
jgi:hypothetical protein